MGAVVSRAVRGYYDADLSTFGVVVVTGPNVVEAPHVLY